ncbi:MAG: DUF1289 domain-containing protein [Rudaea sp.]|nr:DUF1289 domain-containing protein [Rudaea sp.]
MLFSDPPKAILSPCIGICRLDTDGVCAGCHRTAGEIARWLYYTDTERARLMDQVLPQREQRRAGK